jgi:hypothetical protein
MCQQFGFSFFPFHPFLALEANSSQVGNEGKKFVLVEEKFAVEPAMAAR